MTQPPPDRLSTSLQSLGETRASEDFTERVLGGLDRRLERRARRRTAAMVATAAGLVLLVAVGLSRIGPTVPASSTQTRAEEIRREHQQLVEELEELRNSRELTPGVLYLGGNEDYDLVLDLNPLLDEMTREAALPAAYSPATRPATTRQAPRRQP